MTSRTLAAAAAAAALGLLQPSPATAGLCGLTGFGCCPQAAPAPACYTANRMERSVAYRTVYDTVVERQTDYVPVQVTENAFVTGRRATRSSVTIRRTV